MFRVRNLRKGPPEGKKSVSATGQMFQKSKERTAAGGQKLFRATPSACGKHFSRDKEGAPFIGGRQQQKSAVRHRKLFQKFNVDSRKSKSDVSATRKRPPEGKSCFAQPLPRAENTSANTDRRTPVGRRGAPSPKFVASGGRNYRNLIGSRREFHEFHDLALCQALVT